MTMKARKKITSLALAVAMLTSLSSPIHATGEGETEGTNELVDTITEPEALETVTFLVEDVFSVALPVISRNSTVFDFIMDPQSVIEKTDAARYEEGTHFEWNTLYFANTNEDGSLRGYSGMSDPLTITNRSSMAVDVTLEAWLDLPEGVTLSADPLFEGDTSPSIYLALTDGWNTFPITYDGALLTVAVPADWGAYEIVGDAEQGFYYALTEEAQSEDYDGFPTYSFALVGACNPNGDWLELAHITPTVTVQWTVTPQQTEPTFIDVVVPPEQEPIEEPEQKPAQQPEEEYPEQEPDGEEPEDEVPDEKPEQEQEPVADPEPEEPEEEQEPAEEPESEPEPEQGEEPIEEPEQRKNAGLH